MRPARLRLLTAGVLAALALTACGGGSSDDAAAVPSTSAVPDLGNFASVSETAKGQTVNWYMYGGDDKLNAYVNGYVTTELAKRGVTLNQVKVTDTVEVVNKVLGEKQAGKDDDGSVDMIWINGENFKTGKQASLWYCGWDKVLPSAANVDFADAAVQSDFGEPVEGCEAAWNRAQSVLVHDSAKVPAASVASLPAFEAWVKAHPGRFTYAAPPDFTGSMVVRTFFYDTARYDDALFGPFDQATYDQHAPATWTRLNALEPSLYRSGKTYPQGGPDVAKLYGQGEIDAYLTYDSGGTGKQVSDGTFPASTRQAVFADGTIGNVSFLAIPYNSPHKAGAMVLADLLQSPAAQYEKLVNGPGYYPGIDVTRSGDAAKFAQVPTPESQLPFAEQVKNGKPELTAEWLTRLEKDWKASVLQK